MAPVETFAQCSEDSLLDSVVNHTIVTSPTIQQPAFDLTHHTWHLPNHFQMVKVHVLQIFTDGALPNELYANVANGKPRIIQLIHAP